jgi:hypothetical protein
VELLIYDAAACEADPQLGQGGPSVTAGPGGLLADGLDIDSLCGANGAGDSGFFFNAVTESYNHFLAGEDDACEVIDNKVAQAFNIKHKAIEGELERMKAQNEAMKAELQALKGEKSPLPALTSQQSLLKQEIDQETRKVRDLEHTRDSLNATLLQHSRILKDKGGLGSDGRQTKSSYSRRSCLLLFICLLSLSLLQSARWSPFILLSVRSRRQ